MRPEQVIDMQSDLYQRTFDRFFRRHIEAVLSSALIPMNSEEESRVTRENMYAMLGKSVQMAYAYRVTHDMSLLVQHAASTLDETDTFMHDLAPSDFGIVLFERPLPIYDVRGQEMLVHWMVWGKAAIRLGGVSGVGSVSYWFNDMRLNPDEVQQRLWGEYGHAADRYTGRWGFIGADIYPTGVSVGPVLETVEGKAEAALRDEGVEPQPFTNTIRYLHALWLLLGQSVSTSEDEWVRRTAFRRAQRLGIQPRVTVIRLRRNEGNRHEGESLVDWSHRWLVRGHPRWQPYGERAVDHEHILGPVEAVNGHSVKRCQVSGCGHYVARIWIAPYVKGPDDKPLRFTEHVYDLVR